MIQIVFIYSMLFMGYYLTAENEATPYDSCVIHCEKYVVIYGSTTKCFLTKCSKEAAMSLNWVIDKTSSRSKITTQTGGDNSIQITTDREKVSYWQIEFFNPAIDYRAKEYRFIGIRTEPMSLNAVTITISTSAIASISADSNDTLGKSAVDSSGGNDNDQVSSHFYGEERNISPFWTWWGKSNSKSQIWQRATQVFKTATLGLFGSPKLEKNYDESQLILHYSPFSGSQKLQYSVAPANLHKDNKFKLKIYLGKNCLNTFLSSDDKQYDVKKKHEDITLCESDGDNKCEGTTYLNDAAICVAVTCNDNYRFSWINSEDNAKDCQLNYSFQFIYQTKLNTSEINAKIKEMNVNRPLRFYVLIFCLILIFMLLICVTGIILKD